MLDPGQYRTKLIYQEPADDRAKEYRDVCAVFARVRPIRGTEDVEGSQSQARTSFEVTCRYRPEIQPRGRFVVSAGGQVLNVEGVVDWECRRAELTITCTAQDGA